MSVTSFSIFSLFPVELVRLIFEVAARDDSPTAASLVCVSRLVYKWTFPLLYQTVAIKRGAQLSALDKSLGLWGTSEKEYRECGARRTHFIRSLALSEAGSLHSDASLGDDLHVYLYRPDIPALLRACSNLQNLYINGTLNYTSGHEHTCLRRLHCGSWESWMNEDFLILDSLTHLRVDLAFNTGVSASWSRLLPPSKALPNLTHFAIGTDSRNVSSEQRLTMNFLKGILMRPGLKLLVVTAWYWWPDSGTGVQEMLSGASDPRLCILTTPGCPNTESSFQDWEDDARGRRSIWDRAEAIIKEHHDARRHGVAIGPAVA